MGNLLGLGTVFWDSRKQLGTVCKRRKNIFISRGIFNVVALFSTYACRVYMYRPIV